MSNDALGEASVPLGAMVRTWRIRALLTQEELAARAGLAARTIRRLEQNERCRPRTASVRMLMDALGLDEAERSALTVAARGSVAAEETTVRRSFAVAVPQQLPASVTAFAGRLEYLRQLDEHLGEEPGGATTTVLTISGPAGVGKTALANHWAHRVAWRYPDGQLFVNLRGFGPSGEPAKPADVLCELLTALGVPADRVPHGADARASLYRSLLAKKRVLILLDNARDADQVRPLLPAAAGCTAVVTSRNHLMGLVVAEGALPVTVGLLSYEECRSVLSRRLGTQRVEAEPAAVDEIITSCARLPLALAIVAGQAATHPDFPLATVAAELRKAGAGLDVLVTSDDKADVRAAFSWSYQALSAPAARFFRLLGLHPGPDITAAAAASLAGVPVADARTRLGELAEANLKVEHAPGRYVFHDLLRAYASELAQACDSPSELRAALERLLDHYLHTAHAAARLLDPEWPGSPPMVLCDGTAPEQFADDEHAIAWFDAEAPVLRSVVVQAARTGLGDRARWLALGLAEYFAHRGLWDDLLDIQHTALKIASPADDPAREAESGCRRAIEFPDRGGQAGTGQRWPRARAC